MIRYINVADESAALLLSLMQNCNKTELPGIIDIIGMMPR